MFGIVDWFVFSSAMYDHRAARRTSRNSPFTTPFLPWQGAVFNSYVYSISYCQFIHIGIFCVFILSTIFCALLCCFFGNDFCVFHSSTASKYDSSYFFFAFPASQLSDITCDTVCRVFLFCLFFVAAVVAVAVAVVESQTANYCCILGANFSAVSSYSVFAYRCILRSVPV